MFKLVSNYKPTGDQPQAIEKLVDGVEKGYKEQTLLGVTGSGKTFTMANIIAKLNRPTLVLAHNKTLAGQLCAEFKEFFPENAVEICENPAEKDDGYCFAENFLVNEENVEEIIVYKWNRLYPADTYFNIDFENWNLTETVDFEGSSHEKITRERYVR